TPADTNKYTTPIDPTFDLETLGQLGSRIQVPVDLSLEGDYLTDPSEESTGSPSADLSDVQPEQTPTPVQEEIVVEEIPTPIPPQDSNQSVSPTPDETL
ncbi:MAG TPA: hypothetical protein PLD54_00825, partial [Candidatus Levybacteria bacterium]|nr:hypothetical protein [Candidatus Levybacteria bacterium]